MRVITTLLVLCLTVSAHALDWDVCLRYLYPDAPEGAWELQDDSNGKGVRIVRWNLPTPQPGEEELKQVEEQACIWYAALVRERKGVSADTWTDQELRTAVSVLVAEINQVRCALGLEERTLDDIREALERDIESSN